MATKPEAGKLKLLPADVAGVHVIRKAGLGFSRRLGVRLNREGLSPVANFAVGLSVHFKTIGRAPRFLLSLLCDIIAHRQPRDKTLNW